MYRNSKINGDHKGFYLPISKLHSILTVPNLLAPNNLLAQKPVGYRSFCC